jgi:hypothetical protein
LKVNNSSGYFTPKLYYRSTQALADELIFKECGETFVAVVEHIHHEKDLVHFVVNQQVRGHFKAGRFRLNPVAGQCLSVRLRLKQGKEGSYYETLTVKETMEEPGTGVLKSFSGVLRMAKNQDVGFVGDVFVPASLLGPTGPSADTMVRGSALISWNSRKQNWGWKAIWVEKLPL